MNLLSLNSDWQLKQRDPQLDLTQDFATPTEDGWIAASVPGVVQQDLLREGLIPDPFVGLNEHAAQWVGEVDWLYRSKFELPTDFNEVEALDLCLDGLDTFGTVWLNGVQLLTNDNMFVPHRIDVKKALKPGQNELNILIESALRRGKEREKTYGELVRWNPNSDSSRLYVRKAQYHYGWDWGPTLLTAGIWQEVRLESYTARLTDLACPVEISADLTEAVLPVSFSIEGPAHQPHTVELTLYGPDDQPVDRQEIPAAGGQSGLAHTFRLDNPRLWWVRGYGEQAFYRLEAQLLDRSGTEQDRQSLRLGLRRIRLVQEPLEGETGTSFYFEVNNLPIFAGGANWIPADSFLPRLTEPDYRRWLERVAAAHMVMVRVWGGGIYEAEAFYDLCDELGLLVWQDFMFACGMYPAHDSFQTSVRAEAEAQVRRLRHHPCLALWCGNNEDYLVADSVGAYDPAFEGDLATSSFPARAIYEELLPQVCQTLDPTNLYWPGSPYGGQNANLQTEGDRHTWEVWHAPMADYHLYGSYKGRFVSEFGMQALPVLPTIEAFAAPEERYVGSHTLDHHNKATDGGRRMAVYLSDNLRLPTSFEEYVYATQLIQSEALLTAVRDWRREWAGPQAYRVGGALVWQINDCWPVTSWAIVDYFDRPKPAYYTMCRELAPLALGLSRPDPARAEVSLWVANSRSLPLEASLLQQTWTLSGELLEECQTQIQVAPNGTTELVPRQTHYEGPVVLSARLEVGDSIVARTTLWPEPLKYCLPQTPHVELTRFDANHLEIKVDRPIKGLWLEAVGASSLKWSDNMLDLVPGDPQIVSGEGLHEVTQLKLSYLGGSVSINLADLASVSQ